ncbi:3-keto-5-aminohexanoate cleavage protein [Chloroflexota bacterium]
MDPLIISVATTGNWPTREHTPYVPLTPKEIAAAAVDSWREGAAIVHIHVRNSQGKISLDRELFGEAMELIRAVGCDIIINLTTSGGVGQLPDEERFNPLELKPELASFDAGSINFQNRVFVNSPEFLERLAQRMLDAGVKPEIECFDTAMITNALALAQKGLIKPPLLFQFVLGVPGAGHASAKQLLHMVELIPAGSVWSVCGIGPHQLPLNTMAVVMGGHARTGLEDNIYYRKGELATSNAQLVARLARIARECERKIASPYEAREILGLPPGQ